MAGTEEAPGIIPRVNQALFDHIDNQMGADHGHSRVGSVKGVFFVMSGFCQQNLKKVLQISWVLLSDKKLN